MSAGVEVSKPPGAVPGSSRDAATPQHISRTTGSNGTGARLSAGSLSSGVVVNLEGLGGLEALVVLLTSIDVLGFA